MRFIAISFILKLVRKFYPVAVACLVTLF